MQFYHFEWFSGAQDWFTLLSFDQPELIYPLDCKFNRQINLDYAQSPWLDSFYNYHQCHNKTSFENDNAAIVHLNGNSTNFGDYKIMMELGWNKLSNLKEMPIIFTYFKPYNLFCLINQNSIWNSDHNS